METLLFTTNEKTIYNTCGICAEPIEEKNDHYALMPCNNLSKKKAANKPFNYI